MDIQKTAPAQKDFKKDLELCRNQLEAITRINSLLSSDMRLDEIMENIIDDALRLFQANCGSLLLIEPDSVTMHIEVARGLDQAIIDKVKLRVGSGISGWVAEHGEPLLLLDGIGDPRLDEEMMGRPQIKDALCVPLRVSQKVLGVLNISNSIPGKIFDNDDLGLLEVFANQAALAVQKAQTIKQMRDTFELTVAALSKTVDARDPFTFGHSRAVRDYSVGMASYLGFDENRLEQLTIAALLHDIGKISISDNILLKPGPLSKEEYEVIKTHPVVGARIIEPIPYMANMVPFVRHHHERIDGKGYPAGLHGSEIPLEAKILAISDSFDAMTSTRPYRQPLSMDKILDELERGRNKQFDSELLDIFLHEFRIKQKVNTPDFAARDSARTIMETKERDRISLYDLALETTHDETQIIIEILGIIVNALFEKLKLYTGTRITSKIEGRLNVFAMENGLPYLVKQGHLQIFTDETKYSLGIVKNFEGYFSFAERTILQITGDKIGSSLIQNSLACLNEQQKEYYLRLFG